MRRLKTLSIRLDPADLREVLAIAHFEDRSVSHVGRRLVTAGLAARRKPHGTAAALLKQDQNPNVEAL